MNDIIGGVYKQGEILNEKQLIEKYGVSKSPIRDALIELCNEGVLVSYPRYGYEIVRINEKEIRDIVEFRAMVEGECLRGMAAGMSQEDLKELKEYTLSLSQEITEDFPVLKHWENNTRFHLKLFLMQEMITAIRLWRKAAESLQGRMLRETGKSGEAVPGRWIVKII